MADKTFYHSGDIGDVVYSLLVMQHMGGGYLWLGQFNDLGMRYQAREGIHAYAYMALAPLVAKQLYVQDVNWAAYPPFVVNDLCRFRYFWRGDFADVFGANPGQVNLQHMHLVAYGIDPASVDEREPWLACAKDRRAAVVFARSARYHNWKFPWAEAVARYKRNSCFVGLRPEYDAFVHEFPEAAEVPYIPTATLLELACIIHASDLFVGNQSAPYAIAEGLKVNTVQETRIDVERNIGADCVFKRPNAQFVQEQPVNWPNV